MHGSKRSISLRVVPAPSSVVPAKAGTQSCAKKNDKIIVLTNVFLGPRLRGGDGERSGGDGERSEGDGERSEGDGKRNKQQGR